jgi:hypothetical protein
MARKGTYWVSTAIVALMLLGSLSYLTGSEQVVSGFAKAGYPQHLRIVLDIAKPLAAIVLLLPGFALLKEWTYAGVTFAWVMASLSAYSSGEPVQIWISHSCFWCYSAFRTRPGLSVVELRQATADCRVPGAERRGDAILLSYRFPEPCGHSGLQPSPKHIL